MHRKTTIILSVLATLCIVAVASATAASNSPNTFGRGGSTPKISANCQRLPMTLTPAGKSWDGATPNGKQFVSQALTVIKTQLDCANRRTQRIMKCTKQPVPAVSEAPADKQGYHDTKGLDALRAYIVAENSCIAAVVGTR